ncbi:hepatocyte growth factor activator-like isoform X2 [Scyliorhinus torazame]|uniref:hepatocyte growth factor activator-like isoform X2 n=1 Tax=Scyliorhinus torazame TaxID=75743 RepID=UPI003B5A7616
MHSQPSVILLCCYLAGGLVGQSASQSTSKLGVPRDGHEHREPPHPLQHPRTVFTVNGWPCVFPFRFSGKLHRTCISIKDTNRKWCAITPNFDKDGARDYCEEIEPLTHDYCEIHPCWHGAACINIPTEQSYQCICTDQFTGRDCEKEKCFERQHLKYYNIGEKWKRILRGDVEICFCTKGGIYSQAVRSEACETNPCLYGGMCRQVETTGESVCACRKKYTGKYCEIDSAADCYENNGSSYRGTVKRTSSGSDCLRWTSAFISPEFNINEVEEPLRVVLGDHAYCRNTDNDDGPWCYTLIDDDISWEYCDIPQCPKEDPCLSYPCKNGGTCTKEPILNSYQCRCNDQFAGVNCQEVKCFDGAQHRYFLIGERWIRIVGDKVDNCVCVDGEPECHRVQYEDCKVNQCLQGGECRAVPDTREIICQCREGFAGKYCDIDTNATCYADNGMSYKGTEDESSSLIECMPWNEDFLRDRLNISSLEEALQLGLGDHSYCRNPDGDEKPWCYIMLDNHVSWEHCDIAKCGSTNAWPRRVSPIARFAASIVPRQQPLCGKRARKGARPRIIGGSSAMPGSQPWLAAIYLGRNVCAGTLIYSCWVVSAAHCFARSPLTSSIRVVLGQHHFNKTSKNTQEFGIEKYIVHGDYNLYDETKHDIVLLKLKKKNKRCAIKSRFVRTLCLPASTDYFPANTVCQIAGWGYRHENATEHSKTLQEAFVPIISQSLCRSDFVYGREVTPNMGDSGGPLVCYKGDTGYLYGIVSWGDGCGQINKPGVYTRVTNYMEWIYRKIKRRPKCGRKG